MRLGDHIKTIRGMRFLVDELEIQSPAGRRAMRSAPLLVSLESICESLDCVASVVQALEGTAQLKVVNEITMRLMHLRDAAGSVVALRTGAVLSDIDLFEIKSLALLSEAVRQLVEESALALPKLPELDTVIEKLDPEGKRLVQFHVYDAYSIELKEMRKEHRAMTEGMEREDLWIRISALEDRIRQRLSRELKPASLAIEEALQTLGAYDFIIAKAKYAHRHAHVCPDVIQEGDTVYEGLRHIEVEAALNARGREYQPVDLTVPLGVTLVTGANMAGKTVLLRAVAVAQLMTQYGFFLPANRAVVCPVKEVYLSVGDAQDERAGLSSYGAEMMLLTEILDRAAMGHSMLVLIDEPARTTNPTEGQAIASALVDLLAESPEVRTIVTTHYSDINAPARRLRVRGFVEERVVKPLRVNDLNDCIDYRLDEVTETDVPHEALRIAEILGVYPELIHKSSQYIESQNENK